MLAPVPKVRPCRPWQCQRPHQHAGAQALPPKPLICQWLLSIMSHLTSNPKLPHSPKMLPKAVGGAVLAGCTGDREGMKHPFPRSEHCSGPEARLKSYVISRQPLGMEESGTETSELACTPGFLAEREDEWFCLGITNWSLITEAEWDKKHSSAWACEQNSTRAGKR